jgi:hypothetical protein
VDLPCLVKAESSSAQVELSCEMGSPMRIEIHYTDRKGASSMHALTNSSLYDALMALRQRGVKQAAAWTIDDAGKRIEQVGGIERQWNDDRYQVWSEN